VGVAVGGGGTVWVGATPVKSTTGDSAVGVGGASVGSGTLGTTGVGGSMTSSLETKGSETMTAVASASGMGVCTRATSVAGSSVSPAAPPNETIGSRRSGVWPWSGAGVSWASGVSAAGGDTEGRMAISRGVGEGMPVASAAWGEGLAAASVAVGVGVGPGAGRCSSIQKIMPNPNRTRRAASTLIVRISAVRLGVSAGAGGRGIGCSS